MNKFYKIHFRYFDFGNRRDSWRTLTSIIINYQRFGIQRPYAELKDNLQIWTKMTTCPSDFGNSKSILNSNLSIEMSTKRDQYTEKEGREDSYIDMKMELDLAQYLKVDTDSLRVMLMGNL